MSFVKFTSLNYRDPVNPTFAYTSYSAEFTLNALAGTTTTPGASATPTANGAIGFTAPGVVSSTIGLGMVISFASFFLGVLAFRL
ncbi:hypothetical protein FRC04_007979 [Tulasnella sp. 424]|nr:hypothetical protein FRC04_007979 [Tulasnella sp. 424]KAG8974838.1 hypothetical protein FRC05_006771 [Tulasnella sp. 425]